MYDDDDDDLEPAWKGVPALPRDLREKLFDLSEPEAPALRYPGPELWPQRFKMGAATGFTKWRNPTKRKARVVLHLGPDTELHIAFEMRLVPSQYRVSRGIAGERLRSGLALRSEYVRMSFEVPPDGTIDLPAEFDRAIRMVKDGVVQGGHCPFFIKEGEKDPPEINPALLPPEDNPPPFTSGPAAARRRS